jgi:protein involved in polysaccharide export with SLBB domain
MSKSQSRQTREFFRSSPRFVILVLLLSLVTASPYEVVAQQALVASVSRPNEYRLHSGDTISVFYRRTPEYNQSLPILPDGSVNLRLIGPVHVDGLEVEQARTLITAEARKRLKNPEISLSVVDFVRDQYTVMGEVGKPGRYEIHGSTNITDALAMAGGFTQVSAQRKVVLVRALASNSEYGNATVFDFKQLTRIETSTELPLIHNGDLIIVTTSKFAKANMIIKMVNVGLYYSPLPSP